MSLDRFFAAPENWNEGFVVLGSEESSHCRRVLRKRVGDRIAVFDGEGRWAVGTVGGDTAAEVQITVEEEGQSSEGLPTISLAVAIPKGKTMDLIVQKAVELGVQMIQPLVTEHTVVRLEEGSAGRKRDRWQRVALEACKQCGRNVLPRVEVASSLEDWLGARAEGSVGLLASLTPGVVSLKEATRNLPVETKAVELLVGPEGDFSQAESEAALAKGFQAVSFGEVIMRVETAVMFGLSVLGYELRP